jgi:hypothetical protein
MYRNMRISELALRVRSALAEHGRAVEIDAAYGYTGVRNYRVSGRKIANVLDFRAVVTVEESVANALEHLKGATIADLENPRHYNIRWLKFLEEAEGVLGAAGSLWGIPARPERTENVRSLRAGS